MARSAGINWRGDDIAEFGQHMGRWQGELLDALYAEMQELGQTSMERMRRRIESSGTMTRPEGRVETGALRDAVSYEVTRRGDEVTLRFGWPHGGPAYLRMQDLGTRELEGRRVDPFNKPGVGIPGMFALLDTFVEIRDEFKERGA